jgi:flavin reductase (DIM6/NTAB) family NADH-FMN oxidoreductase RutF
MKKFDTQSIKALDKISRLNLINSCTGFKSANLIATKSTTGIHNVAIFSSITHLGSDPALLGFIVRPTVVPRDTYKNIRETGFFTVNHVVESMIQDAHHTAANYDFGVSEFDKTTLEAEMKENIDIPFVKGSPVQLLCKYVSEYPIAENNTVHIIASIEQIFVDETILHPDHWLQLDKASVVSINGLDGYCVPKLIDRFAYSRQDEATKSML